MATSKAHLKPQARALYAQGVSLSEIGDSLGVSTSTVSRWRSAAEDTATDWDRQRDDHESRDPVALLEILERRREQMAEAGPGDEAGSWADTLWKVQRVIESVRDEFEDITTQMAVLTKFARFVGEELPEEDLRAVQRATAAYLQHIKKEAGQ